MRISLLLAWQPVISPAPCPPPGPFFCVRGCELIWKPARVVDDLLVPARVLAVKKSGCKNL